MVGRRGRRSAPAWLPVPLAVIAPSVPPARTPRAPRALRTLLHLAAVFAATLGAPAAAHAQPAAVAQPAAGIVAGRVRAAGTGEPLVGAVVRVLPRGAAAGEAPTGAPATQTDDAGTFTLRGVAPGVVRVEVRRLGFAPRVVPDVVVRAGKPAELLVELAPLAAALQAVTVRPSYFPTLAAPSTPVSTNGFSAEEVRRAPGVQEDVVRALSVLPGVGVTTAARNDLVVRGGAPVENLFLVDGLEVPNVNHFGSQGSTGGPVSLLNIDFVREASLSAGGFGAAYGDRTSSVTDIRLREGTRERVAGQLNLSATGFGAFAEGPLGGGSFLAGARRSYLDLLFRAAGASFIPAYQDLTIKTVHRPTRRDELSFLLVGARGTVTLDNSTEDGRFDNRVLVAPAQDQYFTGLTWRRTLRRGTLTTIAGRTYTQYATAQRDTGTATTPPQVIFRADTREGENQLRTALALELAPGTQLELGNLVRYADALRYDVTLPGFLRRDADGAPRPLRVDTTFSAVRNATWAQLARPLGARLRLTVGARLDWWGFLDDAARVSPRAALAWQLDERSTLTLAGGRYWQAPQFIWLIGDPTNAPGAPGGGVRPFRADQAVLGWRRTLRPDLQLQVEGYVKRYAGYPARVFRPRAVLQPSGFDDATTDIPFGLEPLASLATGRAEGVEVLLQKKLSEVPVYGLASVSVNRTTFTALDGGAIRGAFDVPVIVNALAGWRPNVRWELSARVRGASGLLTTPFVTTGPLAGTLDFARYNAGGRLPAFFALDLRADRRFTRRSGRQLIVYLDVQNATGRRNVGVARWNPRLGAPEANEGLGVLPSVGVNWAF